MPKITNQETGETKEVSMEELMEMVRSGKGSLQQVVTHADGSKSTTTLYGNAGDDGLDRFNIFVDKEAFNAFLIRKFKILNGEIEETESEKYPGEQFEMTVDFTDLAVMGILRATDKELSINLYTRDERKSASDHLRQASKSWKIDPDGTFDFNTGDLQGEDRDASLYMISFVEMRRFLRASGKLDELKKLGNRGTGVIIKATGQADDAEAIIVQGKGRPDLPCEVFLLGNQMMRPYMDEMMAELMMAGASLEDKIKTAEDGDTVAMEELAMIYLNGDDEQDVEPDPEKCVYWLRKLAEAGDSNGMFNLGLHYAKGYGVERDFGKAVYWMEKAAEAGDEDAPGVVEEYKKLADSVKKAESGDAQAQADLAGGLMKLGGSLDQAGPGEDYAESVKWAEKSAAQNNGDGLWTLALAYEHGRGVKQDKKKAVELYRQGAELGHAKSQHSLGCYYMRGEIVKADQKKAFDLFMKAAQQGYGLAMEAVGSCYQFANGVNGNMKTAIEWYEKALEVMDDPELESKVAIFKQISEADEGFDKDYPMQEDDDSEEGSSEPVIVPGEFDSYEEALDAAIKNEAETKDNDGPQTARFDEFLSFNLPDGYRFVEEKDDNGDLLYKIQGGKIINEEGEETYDYFVTINKGAIEDSPFSEGWEDKVFRIDGKPDAFMGVAYTEMKVMIFTVGAYAISIWIREGSDVYVLTSKRAVKPNDTESISGWTDFLNNVLASVILDGVAGEYEKLTAEMLISKKKNIDEEIAKTSGIPVAKPLEGQHTHLDFLNTTKDGLSSFLGGLVSVNQTGTEYEFEAVSEMAERTDDADLSSIYTAIAEADAGDFDLVETAHDMAELFRVDVAVFDCAHDREQEILSGLIHRAAIYNTFRSFAWTLSAYCEKEGCQPAELPFSTVKRLVDFISDRQGLNYTADSHSPTICSGDDLHNYYIPDSIPEDIREHLLKIENEDAKNPLDASHIRSLDSLRMELDYMYPAVKAIYDILEESRDTEETLTGGVADILYAWCSMTYAARQPFHTEDGPMNCFWEHPDNQEDWETKWKVESLERAIKQGNEWIERYNNDISHHARISFKDKVFVFTGVSGLDEWLDILRKLQDLGGIQRSAVSGKTDYLICNPMYAGDSQVRRALEQKIKGKDVKIVLFEDFLKAMGIQVRSPEEELAALKAGTEKKPAAKRIKQVERPAAKQVEDDDRFTFDEHLQGRGPDYVMYIPDGFVFKKDPGDRAFIAYIPDEEDPEDENQSRFIIYAGKRVENEALKTNWKTVAEYVALAKTTIREAAKATSSDDNVRVSVIERRDLPGAIGFIDDFGCMHANAFVGIGDHIQTMRFMIMNVNSSNKAKYESAVMELMDRMTTDDPVELLRPIDDESFKTMVPGDPSSAEWQSLISEYVNHFALARTMEMNELVNKYKVKIARANLGLPGAGSRSASEWVTILCKEIKKVISHYSKLAETELLKAEPIYTQMCSEHPDDENLNGLKEAINLLAAFADQVVNLDDKTIEVKSKAAAEALKRMPLSPAEIAEQKKQEEERIRKEKEKEERKRKEEERRKAEAEAKRKAEEERKRKEEERRRKEEEERKRKAEEEAERKRKEEEARISNIYQDAMVKAGSNDLKTLRQAKSILEGIADKRDVTSAIAECESRIQLAEEREALRKKKLKKKITVGLIITALVAAAALGAYLFLQGRAKATFTEQLTSNMWYECGDNGTPYAKLQFTDQSNATRYNKFDVLNNKWADPYLFTWSFESVSSIKGEAVIKMADGDGEELISTVVKNRDGSIERITGENYAGEYVPISDEDLKVIVEKMAADERVKLYQEAMTKIRNRSYDGLGDILNKLGDYKDCPEILAELTEYGRILSSFPGKGEYKGREVFEPAIRFAESAKYIKFSSEMENFLKAVAPFVGKWSFSGGDARTMSYGAKDSARFYSIDAIEVECEVDVLSGTGTLHFLINDGSKGMYVSTSYIDPKTRSFSETKYVGADFVFSITDDDELHIEAEGESGMPAPSSAAADYSRAD